MRRADRVSGPFPAQVKRRDRPGTANFDPSAMPPVHLQAMLARFADSLKPASDVEHEGNMLLNEIIQTVERKTRFTIRRVAKAGSMAKHTAINVKLDYDCIFYVEEQAASSAVRGFLDDVDNILTLSFPDLAGRQTQHADSFFYKGYYFDFLCCQHLDQQPEQQVRKALHTQEDTLKVSLSEGTVIFMKEQSSFVHQLARLLKFWSHSVQVPGFFNGRSYTMELLAVAAAEEETNRDLLRGFRLALDKIRNFQKVRKVWTRFYGEQDASKVAQSCSALLLDPTDFSNNLLAQERWPFFEKLAQYANCTLERLHHLEYGVSDVLVGLFRPQPDIWVQMPFVPRTNSLLVGGEALDVDEAQPRAILQRPVCPLHDMNVIAHMLHGMLVARRFALLEAGQNGGSVSSDELQRMILEDAREQLKQCIDTAYGTFTWSPSAESFLNKSVVLVLPIGGAGRIIKVGFEVDANPKMQSEPGRHFSEQSSPYWSRRHFPRMTAYST